MMKLGKADILVIVECGLLLLGAIFLAIVFINPANPVWALWVGLLLAAAGIVVWVGPLLVGQIKKLLAKRQKTVLKSSTDFTGAAKESTTTDYELHRPVNPTATTPEPFTESTTVPVTEPITATTEPTTPTEPATVPPVADNNTPPAGLDLDF